jgi:acetolactate decarboxylase
MTATMSRTATAPARSAQRVIEGVEAQGGHSLDFALGQGHIAISTSSDLHLSLPRTEAFLKANLAMSNIAQQIHQTED